MPLTIQRGFTSEGIAGVTPRITPETDTTPVPPAQVSTIVKRVFRKTWNDYHEFKPPSTLAYNNGQMSASMEEIDEEMIRRHRELSERRKQGMASTSSTGTSPATSHGPASDSEASPSAEPSVQFAGAVSGTPVVSNPSRSTWTSLTYNMMSGSDGGAIRTNSKRQSSTTVTISNKATWKCQPPTAPVRFHSLAPISVEPVPLYWFCRQGDRCVYKESDKAVPFRHVFEDDSFDEYEYHQRYNFRCGWTGAWRDPDMDIIQVEAVRRLKAYNLSVSQIDQTRVLPSELRVIENIDISRDLPPFPYGPTADTAQVESDAVAEVTTSSQNHGKRKWGPPAALKEEEYDNKPEDYDEGFCTRQDCTMAGCLRHSAFDYGILNFHSIHGPVQPNKRQKLSKLGGVHVLRDIETPCSGSCAMLSDEDSLVRASLQDESWPDQQTHQLLDLVLDVIDRGQSLRPCDLLFAFVARTCQEIAINIIKLKEAHRHQWLAPPSPAISITTEPQRGKRATFRPASYSSHTPNFMECHHEGPCVEDVCGCVERGMMCGRNCGCASDCLRRFKGCQCQARFTASGRPATPKICMPDKCPCNRLARECDPALCGPCGSAAEIERARHLKDRSLSVQEIKSATQDIRGGCCGNVNAQKGLYPRLRVGISPVAGYGIFATQNIPARFPIGEYVGEWISIAEGIRRDLINQQIGRTYMFTLNKDTEIDSGNYGNYTRYFNTGKGIEANCRSCLMTVNDEPRIIFYTNREIKKNEEIRFDYGTAFDANAKDLSATATFENAKR
ncbi:hypothetical protein IAT40_000722 [Kwoniella sp. CBS 6097]